MPQTSDDQSKIFVVEVFSELAGLSVTIIHFQKGLIVNNECTNNGRLKICFFFVLAGLVIALSSIYPYLLIMPTYIK